MRLCEAGETPESRGILQQSLMLKVPVRLFISGADGRLASSCWPSPSLPLFIEQPRDTLNDTGRGTVGKGRGCKSQKSNAVYFLRLAEKFGQRTHHLHTSFESTVLHAHSGVIFAIVCHHPINLIIGSKRVSLWLL